MAAYRGCNFTIPSRYSERLHFSRPHLSRPSDRIPDCKFRVDTVGEQPIAKRFYVSGMVQGVGYRYFVERVASRLSFTGYVKNLRDGRVEVYAVGQGEVLLKLREELIRGPRAATVSNVAEEDVSLDVRYSSQFTIEFDSW